MVNLSWDSVYYYGVGTTVNASASTAEEVFGLVTRTSQIWAPWLPSFLAMNVTMIVFELTTCVVTIS